MIACSKPGWVTGLAAIILLNMATLNTAAGMNCVTVKQKVKNHKPVEIACYKDRWAANAGAMATGGGVEIKDAYYDTRVIQNRPGKDTRTWVCQIINAEGPKGPLKLDAYCYAQCCSSR